MFAQVIRGKTKDAAGLRGALDRWEAELKPGASGYLGSTGGVADDGTFVMVVRFASEEAARANSQRPEQGSWWEEVSKLFEGDVQFFDCPRVITLMGGGSDEASFVQVMIYRPHDTEAALEMAKEFEKLQPQRPDILGGTSAVATDGTFIDTNYFTSEAEAREGERQELPAEMQATMQRFGELAGSVEFIDLKEPWLTTA